MLCHVSVVCFHFFFFFFFKFRIEGPVWGGGLGEKAVYILTGHRLKTDLQMQCEILLLMLVDSIMYLPFILSSFTKKLSSVKPR